MNFTKFTELFKDELFYNEFKNELMRLDEKSLEILSDHFSEFFMEEENRSNLYKFANFLYNLIYTKWSGFLNPELIYLTSKVLVLTGLQKKAENVSAGFAFHPGCCSWRLGSFYRNKNADPKELTQLLISVEEFLLQPEILENELLRNDLLAWFVAFKPVDQCYEIYQDNQEKFSKVFPYIILIERFLLNSDISNISYILSSMDEITISSTYEKVLLNNKKAVLYQMRGNQKDSLEWFEKAETLAIKIGDWYSVSKINFNQGSSYFLLDEYDLSLESYQKAETYYKMLQDEIGIGKCYNGLSTVYNAMGEYSIAEKYITMSEEIFENSSQKTMRMGLLYKHGLILHLKGEYEKTIEITKLFDLTEKSILNFEVSMLVLASTFELSRELNVKEIDRLLEIAEVLGYKLGKANLLIEVSKMQVLQGDMTKAIKMLNLSYKLFHELTNHRGVIRCLILNSLIELLNNNLNEAEGFCNTAIEQANNANFYLEGKEAGIILANIFYLKGFDTRARNLMDSILYSFERKKIKNNYLLQTLVNKCHLRFEKSGSILKSDVIDLIRLAKNSGSYYWIHSSRLQEAIEMFYEQRYSNAQNIALEVLDYSKNYDLKFMARKIILKSSIAILGEKITGKETTSEKELLKHGIENDLKELLAESSKKNLFLYFIELQLIKLQYYQVINNNRQLEEELAYLRQLILDKELKIYLQRIPTFEQSEQKIVLNPVSEVQVNYLVIT